MIDFDDKRNLVCVLARHNAQHTKRGCYCVTSAFDGKLYNVFWIEVIGVFGEARAARMLDALADRQDRKITCSAKPTVVMHPRQIAEHTIVAVRLSNNTVYKIRSR